MIINQNIKKNTAQLSDISWATGTVEEIKDIIAQAKLGNVDLSSYWHVGDVRIINVSSIIGSDIELEDYGETSLKFTILDFYPDGFTIDDEAVIMIIGIAPYKGDGLHRFLGKVDLIGTNGWKDSARRYWCNNQFRNSLPSDFASIFKEFKWKVSDGKGLSYGLNEVYDYFALPSAVCLHGIENENIKQNINNDELQIYSQWEYCLEEDGDDLDKYISCTTSSSVNNSINDYIYINRIEEFEGQTITYRLYKCYDSSNFFLFGCI